MQVFGDELQRTVKLRAGLFAQSAAALFDGGLDTCINPVRGILSGF